METGGYLMAQRVGFRQALRLSRRSAFPIKAWVNDRVPIRLTPGSPCYLASIRLLALT